jgi:hypothetical protein
VRDSLPAALVKPSFRLGDGFALVLALWLVVEGSVREGARDRIKHGFKRADHGAELRRGKPLNQFVCVLLLAGGTVCHETEFSESGGNTPELASVDATLAPVPTSLPA